MKNRSNKIILCLLVLFLSGCSILGNQEKEKQIEETIQKDEEKNFVEPYVDDNPIELGLYLNENNNRKRIQEFHSDFTMYTDIVSLEVYYTKEEKLVSGNQKTIWNQYYQNYTGIDRYKIGYHINFKAGDFEVDKTILKLSDVGSFSDYIQIYLYDDIHQNSSWYDHITEDEISDETIFTSIKLTASTKIEEINSPIVVTAFTYDENDFNEDGTYRGKSSDQVAIHRK